MAPETLTAAEMMAIPPGEPGRLFSGNTKTMAAEFRVLAKRWHPDRNGGSAEAAAVFERVVALWEAAERTVAGGVWWRPDAVRLATTDGRSFELKFRRRRAFELGEMAIAMRHVAFLIEARHAAPFEAGLRRIREISYPDAAVRAEIARFMPVVEGVYATAARRVALLAKPADVVLLADLLDRAGGALPPEHVAWIVSSLLNLACFFAASGLTHNALTTATVFVTPQFHAAYPLGGWWYALPAGARLERLPQATFALLPPAIAAAKRADIGLDLECIRAVGRASLGDITGLGLVGRSDLPRPMADFLRLPSSGSAIADYRTWNQVLDDSFGPRRFLELPITSSDVYG
jgi:hypothetical protein